MRLQLPLHDIRMSLKSTEWFIDTFPSIIGLTADSDPSYSEAEFDTEVHASGTASKTLQEECQGDERLTAMCEKFCQVNKCKYSNGVAAIVSPIAGILAEDSPRLPVHLLAVFNFRDRFCLVPPAGQHKTYSARIKSVLGSGPTRTELLDLVTYGLIVGLIRYHRPGCASILDAVFGTNQLPESVWAWMASGFVACCDGAGTARELMASVAATGQAATVALLAVAALDDILSSLPLNSADAIEEAVAVHSVSPEALEKLWQVATEMARATPISFQTDLALHATAHGRKKIKANEADIADDLVVEIRETPLGLLSVPAEDVILELKSIFTNATRPASPARDSSVFSIGEDVSESATCMRLSCIAGTSIETSLRTFSSVSEQPLSPRAISRAASVYIDARTAVERDLDDKLPMDIPHVATSESAREPSAEDWFHESAPTKEGAEPKTSSSDFEAKQVIVHRLKQTLWVDSDMNFAEIAGDQQSAESLFMKKLEFYRGQRICVIGSGSTAKSLLNLLLVREFPSVCSVRGGFAALRHALVFCGQAPVEDLAIVTAAMPDVDRVPTPRSAVMGSLQSAWKEQKDQISSYMHSIDTKDIKAKFSTFFKSKSAAQKPATIVVAPSPVSAAVPIVIPHQTGAEAVFEIGGDEDDYEFSSVDMSPKHSSTPHMN